MVALPYKWIDSERAIFEYENYKYGIFIEYLQLRVNRVDYNVANISFGILKSDKFTIANDLDTSRTNFGKPRTVLSTVGEACVSNKEVLNCDIICLAAVDQIKEKRFNIYQLALIEITGKVKAFDNAKTFHVKSKNGSEIIILSKIKFTEEEQKEISEKLGIDKF